MNIVNKLTTRHIQQNKGRTVVTTLGICVSVAMITAVFVAMASFLNLFGEIGLISSGKWDAEFDCLNQTQINQIENDDRISNVGLGYSDDYMSFKLKSASDYEKSTGEILVGNKKYFEMMATGDFDGKLPENENEVAVEENLLAANGMKNAKVGDALSTGSDLCTIYDLSYLEMTINVDELQVSSLKVGQTVQVTADAVKDKTYEGLVTRVSMKGDTSGGTTTYPVTVRIDETTGLRPGMNANAEIVVAQAKNALTVPNAAIVRGGYVLVRQDSPSAVNADDSMSAPEGYVYVKVKTGVSDDNYTQVTSGLSESDTIAYDPSSVSSDSYYDDGGYDDMGGGELEDTGNNADLAEGGEETLPEETENGEAPAADAEEPAEGIDPAEAGAVVVN